jgi:hypothetical protein
MQQKKWEQYMHTKFWLENLTERDKDGDKGGGIISKRILKILDPSN